MLYEDDDHYYEDDGYYNSNSIGAKFRRLLTGAVSIVIAVIFFFPALVQGYLVFALIRWFRLRPQLILLISAFLVTAYVIVWRVEDYTQNLVDYIQFDVINDLWYDIGLLIGPLLVAYLILGVLGGCFTALFQAYRMKKHPELKAFEGHWMHDFEYRDTPLHVYLKNRRISKLKDGSLRDTKKAPLGLDIENDKVVSRYDDESLLHCLVTGQTGSGKSITLFSMIKNDIMSGKSLIILDLKRSPDFAAKIAKWCDEYNSNFYHFVNGSQQNYDIPHSRGQSFYDPLGSGSNTSKGDMILGMREYDQASAVYKSSMQQLLSAIYPLMEAVKNRRIQENDKTICEGIDWDSGGVFMLASAVQTTNFMELLDEASYVDDERMANVAVQMKEAVNKRGQNNLLHSLSELQGQMRTIITSDYGQWMKTSGTDNDINLFDLTKTNGNVILFSLNSDDEKEFARLVGSIIMSDITRTSAERRNKGIQNHVNIYIDEFQILVPDTVTDLLEKSRASKMGITLAQQSLSQVVKNVQNNGEAYLDSIIDTCSSFVFHAGSGYGTAEKMAKIIGEHKVETYSISNKQDRFIFSLNWRNSRQGMTRKGFETEWIIDPTRFMQLSAPLESNDYYATAMIVKKASSDKVFADKKGGAVGREVWMLPESEILETHYTPTNAETRAIYDQEKKSEIDVPVINSFADVDSLKEEIKQVEGKQSSRSTQKSSVAVMEPEVKVQQDDDVFAENTEISLLELRKQRAQQQNGAVTPEKSVKPKAPAPVEEHSERSFLDDLLGGDGFTADNGDFDDEEWTFEEIEEDIPEKPEVRKQPEKPKAPVNKPKQESTKRKNGIPKRRGIPKSSQSKSLPDL